MRPPQPKFSQTSALLGPNATVQVDRNCCSGGTGSPKVSVAEILLGTTRSSSAIPDCFWGLTRHVAWGTTLTLRKGAERGNNHRSASPVAPSYDKGGGKGGKGKYRDLSTESKGNGKHEPHPRVEQGSGGKMKSESPRPAGGAGAPERWQTNHASSVEALANVGRNKTQIGRRRPEVAEFRSKAATSGPHMDRTRAKTPEKGARGVGQMWP